MQYCINALLKSNNEIMQYYIINNDIALIMHYCALLQMPDLDIIICPPFQMNDLENKLSQEIKPECTVVACRFPFPNWKEIATIGEGVDSVWVYKPGQRIPEMKRGSSIKITLKERPTRKPK